MNATPDAQEAQDGQHEVALGVTRAELQAWLGVAEGQLLVVEEPDDAYLEQLRRRIRPSPWLFATPAVGLGLGFWLAVNQDWFGKPLAGTAIGLALVLGTLFTLLAFGPTMGHHSVWREAVARRQMGWTGTRVATDLEALWVNRGSELWEVPWTSLRDVQRHRGEDGEADSWVVMLDRFSCTITDSPAGRRLVDVIERVLAARDRALQTAPPNTALSLTRLEGAASSERGLSRVERRS